MKRKYYKESATKWRKKNSEKVKLYRDKNRFNIDVNEVLEKYDFKCQLCGMTQEQHIVIFGSRLIIHHLDGFGRTSEKSNNDKDNLIPLCRRCHAKVHREIEMGEKWGDLIEQDDSNWKYPKIRYLVEAEIAKGFGVQEAKKIVSENTGMCFSSIDHRYYMKKIKLTTQKETKVSKN